MLKTFDDLRRFTVARNFPRPANLKNGLRRMSFVQADPIRSPARAQDLILRHRVSNYHAGDLERRYKSLDVEEDFFINYGYVTRELHALMHPRSPQGGLGSKHGPGWTADKQRQAKLILNFVRLHGPVHPRVVDDHFAHGRVTNYWGGYSNATTHLLDILHYRGHLRVHDREKGIRIYAASNHEHGPTNVAAIIDTLIDIVVDIYGPLPRTSLTYYLGRLRYAVPQWAHEVKPGILRATSRLATARIGNEEWFWSAKEKVTGAEVARVLLLAPFDPLVHDRRRFELLWNWPYRFEAYTPVAKRKLGYYAMPLLWRNDVIGWANLAVKEETLEVQVGYAKAKPRSVEFRHALEAELERMRMFLRV